MNDITLLLNQDHIITYKSLSRSLKLNTHTAKSLLQEYSVINPDLYVYYYIYASKGTGSICKVISQDQLSQYKTEYPGLSSHIYSIQPSPCKDPMTFALHDLNVMENDNLHDLNSIRMIKNPSIQETKHSSHATVKVTPITPMDIKKSSNVVSTLSTEKAKSTFTSKKQSESFFGNIKSKHSTKKVQSKEQVQQQVEQQEQKQVQQEEGVEEEVDEVTIQKKPKINPQNVEKNVKKVPEDIQKDSKRESEKSKLLGLFDEEESVKPVGKPVHALPDAQETEAEPHTIRVRKKRKIVKTKTFMEGKYLKTRDVEEWESYSEDETIVPRKPVPVKQVKESTETKESKETTTGKKESKEMKEKKKKMGGNQKTLHSFFGKK